MINRTPRSRRREIEPSVRRHIFVGITGCLLLGLLLFLVWHLARLQSVTLSSIDVTGGETIEVARVKATVNAALEGSYMNLIPHRFFLTYPQDEVLAALMSIDRIKSAQIDRKGRSNLTITFAEYAPFALWCLSLDEKNPCYFLDEEGYAFGQSPLLIGGSLTRHITDGVGELEEKQLFPPARFKEMHEFLTALDKELSLRVTHVQYSEVGDITIYVNGGGKIYIHDKGKYSDVLLNLKTVLGSASFKHLKPGNFQYVDLRFGNKVFVNEEPELEGAGTTTDAVATST